jgi:ribonuclease BN (tRNA processing enzyme)
MRLTVLGSSPSWPNPGEAQSGYLVDTGAGRLLLDCGNGVVSRLRALGGPAPDAIVLSHLHPDHIADVLSLFWGRVAGALDWPTVLYVPPGGRVVLGELVEVWDWRLSLFEAAVPVREYRAATPLEVAGATLRFARTRHSPHSYVVRVEAGGRTLVYTGDTAAVPAVAEHARGADVLLCEATEAETPHEGVRVHLTPSEAAAIAAEAGAARLVLTHVPAELRDAALAVARAARPEAVLALPGLELDV